MPLLVMEIHQWSQATDAPPSFSFHDAKSCESFFLDLRSFRVDWSINSGLNRFAAPQKVITKNLELMMSMVLKCLRDPHPRVRWAACRAIASFFQYFKPHVLEEYHNQVYHKVFVVLDDFHPQVQASATVPLSYICGRTNKPEALIPHLDRIVNKFLLLIQNGKQMVQQGALITLGLAAESVKEHFRTYYHTVMPHLKDVIRNTDLKSDLSLGATAIKCISSIGLAVGKEIFREDAKQIIEVFMPFQGLQEMIDEHTTWEILWACVRICGCIGKEFLPYLSEVITLLIQPAKRNDENCGVDDPTSWSNNSTEKIMFRDKNLWRIYDFVLMKKSAHACRLLNNCTEI